MSLSVVRTVSYNDVQVTIGPDDGLVAGQTYTFRARAQNSLGSLEFSDPSMEITVLSWFIVIIHMFLSCIQLGLGVLESH